MKRAPSPWETLLAFHIGLAKLPAPAREHRFDAFRRWRFDFAWPTTELPGQPGRRLAVEVEGGRWGRGRHMRPMGFAGDCDKYNEAAMQGWLVLRFTDNQVRSGRALDLIKRALDGDGSKS
jgi:very-short-patch-repair endonuclease